MLTCASAPRPFRHYPAAAPDRGAGADLGPTLTASRDCRLASSRIQLLAATTPCSPVTTGDPNWAPDLTGPPAGDEWGW